MQWISHMKSRVLDVFRGIDRDQDGRISQREFIDSVLSSSERWRGVARRRDVARGAPGRSPVLVLGSRPEGRELRFQGPCPLRAGCSSRARVVLGGTGASLAEAGKGPGWWPGTVRPDLWPLHGLLLLPQSSPPTCWR